MRVIVPMAGMGKRMRPHTLTTPKPLIPVAGKPIVQRLVEYLAEMCEDKIEHIAFVVGDFGKEAEKGLCKIAEDLGAKCSIHHQEEALGTAHAILCAKEHLKEHVIIAFADTLFYADFKVNEDADGVIWVQKVENPQQFGVVKLAPEGHITEFIEKSPVLVSNLAIIGIYYFRDGENLKHELQYLLDHDIKEKGEYQLTTAMEHMKNKGLKLFPGEVAQWLDCGNKDATVDTNKQVLEHEKNKRLIDKSALIENSTIIPPTYIGPDVVIKNSVIGPHVSIGGKTVIENSILKNSIIQSNSRIKNRLIQNSMVGNHVSLTGRMEEVSVGDYSVDN
ncbi:MAG: NTP transferase domain-containing protein [Chitinophagaceae bacterium]|nr:NTP transferase domain-containing protein [Chitinophagaceae bacterium]